MKQTFFPRLNELREQYILLRFEKHHDRAVAVSYWEKYRTSYDCTEGKVNDKNDWRL